MPVAHAKVSVKKVQMKPVAKKNAKIPSSRLLSRKKNA